VGTVRLFEHFSTVKFFLPVERVSASRPPVTQTVRPLFENRGVMQNIINTLVEKWDWWIYHQAYHSLKRMCVRNRGFAYLIQLQLNDWIKENPMEQSLVEATEQFYKAMVEHK
jgi:hypothetical protein